MQPLIPYFETVRIPLFGGFAVHGAGALLVLGFATGDIPRVPLNLTLLMERDMRGVYWGAFTVRDPALHRQNLRDLVEMHHGGVINPHISARYPLQDAPRAIADLLERRATGKVVVEVR